MVSLTSVFTASGLVASALALPSNMSPMPENPLKPRALGINCRGSGLCGFATIENNSGENIMQLWHNVLWNTDLDPANTWYNDGDHVVCVGSSASITINPSVSANFDGVGGSWSLSTNANIGTGGVCLFPQGASLNLGQIRDLVDAMGEHGCATCGSVPIHYVDEGSNDPSSGILTSNYVGNPFCDGNCITSVGH